MDNDQQVEQAEWDGRVRALVRRFQDQFDSCPQEALGRQQIVISRTPDGAMLVKIYTSFKLSET